MSDKDKRRITMGEHAASLAASISGGEPPNAAHLEEAILKLKSSARDNSNLTDLIKSEADQLFRELTVESRAQSVGMSDRLDEIEAHMKAMAKSLDAIRIMLNIFGEEIGGADTSELFKEADALMKDVLEPLARKTKAPVFEQSKSEDDARGNQREETEEIEHKEDPDLEINGHAVVQETKEQTGPDARDGGRGG